MSGSAPAAAKDIKSVLDTKPLKFKIQTKGASYVAQIHTDRASYDRVNNATRTSSADSVNSSESK
ncbi:hypothetical protein VMCG_05251 [Cytospora schulzeri]|uniref:Uncharacterized protein n=1 Tax=Cytospora schulzeri TaxID=448051 RepID=A0A423WQK1_9PEZI|nr:hypothetical protein VMCG_05251 [Valsa malicola]